jgi:hydroxymethylglutaryl-CoA reductase
MLLSLSAGANMINTTAEHLAPQVEALANAKVSLFFIFIFIFSNT